MDTDILRQKIEKRTGEIDAILVELIAKWNSNPNAIRLKCLPNAGKIIATIYFEIVNESLKGKYLKEDGFINRYKVAAGSEIAFMLVKPMKFEDLSIKFTDTDRDKLNARFATSVAMQILYAIHFPTPQDYPTAPKDKNIQAALISHMQWVRFFDYSNAYPVYLSSNFWEMYIAAITLEKKLIPF